MKIFAQLDDNDICVALIQAVKAPAGKHIERSEVTDEELGMKWNGSEFEPVADA